MRKQPQVSPPEAITAKQPDSVITQVREYQLITPLYGGGVAPTEADPITIVRATEIRGCLRFWWRACRGGKFNENLADMKKEEDAIWGKAYKKGDPAITQERTIQITVDPIQRGKYLTPRLLQGIPGYAIFPLQEELKKQESHVLLENVSFTLTISFPADRRKDVEAALWAWETFGGIGARTRRGFGALRCTRVKENERPLEIDLPQADQQQTPKWIGEKLATYVADGLWPVGVPHLKKQGIGLRVVNRGVTNDGMAVWKDLIDRLKSFRQRRRPSTRSGGRFGRSIWPEPSAIRQLTRQSLPTHTIPIPNPRIDKFPRAAFGLPIIFQFKDRDEHNPDNPSKDPRQTVLQLATSERLASPIILKPLACRDGAYVGLALILEGTGIEEEQLMLKTQGQAKEWPVKAAFDQGESLVVANENSTSPIRINSQINALQAFLKYL